MKKLVVWMMCIWTLVSLPAQVQAAEMADMMRSEGKIYVVVGVIILIFAVLFIYLLFMDRKLRRLEKELSEK